MDASAMGGRRWVYPLTLVCLVLGGMLGVQVHTQRARGETQVGRQTSALVSMLTQTESQVEQQREEIELLRARLAEYEEEAANEKGLARLLQEELRTSRIALGTVAVKGPGVVIELSDSTRRSNEGFGGDSPFVIHDFELLQITNELWCAGAEAVSLNGERLTIGSAISCSGPLIRVNNVTVGAPFVFKAIGDKDKLVSALNIRGGVLDGLRVLQFGVKLTPMDEVVIPPLTVTPKYTHAEPVEKEVGR